MAEKKISQLTAKSANLASTDLIPIAESDGLGGYVTKHVTGAEVTGGVGSTTIYNGDSQLSSDRTIDCDSNFLKFAKLEYLYFQSNAVPSPSGTPFVDFFIDPSGAPTSDIFKIRDTSTTAFKVQNDGTIEFNEAYTFPTADGTADEALLTDGAGALTFEPIVTQDAVNFGQTQWSRTLPSPQSLANGDTANGFTFFTNSDKVTSGTTSYDEYDIAFGITITLSGTSGTADVNINGTDYTATFNTSLYQTAVDFVSTHETALNADNVRLFALGSGTDGRIRFCASETILNGITVTNVTGDLSGTLANEFTGSSTAVGDHVLVPYVGTAYEGERLNHNFRTNFNLQTSGQQGILALSLRRYADDSIIGSVIQVNKNNDVGGVQTTFLSYTAGSTDPFVVGGFYFALENNIGGSVSFEDGVGILIQTYYQKPTKF